jgi:outer membrane biosynthesis protein TonB
LVDINGSVVSTVLLESSEYDVADQTALTLARAVRFAPADHLVFGVLVFSWHTMPANTP